MAMETELNAFMEIVDQLIDYEMETDVTDAVKKEMASKIESLVYEKYEPKVYERKRTAYGLLDMEQTPNGNLDIHYDNNIKLLTVENVRSDWEPTKESHIGRNVAQVVESGYGYDWRQIEPRPFHKPTEDALITSGEIDRILTSAMETNLGSWSL